MLLTLQGQGHKFNLNNTPTKKTTMTS